MWVYPCGWQHFKQWKGNIGNCVDKPKIRNKVNIYFSLENISIYYLHCQNIGIYLIDKIRAILWANRLYSMKWDSSVEKLKPWLCWWFVVVPDVSSRTWVQRQGGWWYQGLKNESGQLFYVYNKWCQEEWICYLYS